ncbi:sensor histidine kinase [Neobacillus sp. LXY-1]|uniref:sensor histidine kinase n=1 Tax=Neobacillus sp. LXY-1 TaxID=3379133 RepID=UPI003EE37DD0
MFNRVKAKLIVVYTLSLVLLLISFIGLLYFLISKEINEKEADQLEVFFNREIDDFYEDVAEKEHHDIDYEPNRNIFYYVYNRNGGLISGEETDKGLFQWIEQQQYLRTDFETERMTWGEKHFILMKESLGDKGQVLLGMDITAEKHLIQKITWILFLLTILFSVIFAFVGYYFAGEAMKPIKIAFDKQEKFVSDASHELRTPLSIFYSSIDLLMREEQGRLSPLGNEVLEDLKIEAHQMNKLVNDLLILARSDQEQLNLEWQEINLSKLAVSIYQRFSRTISKDITFEQHIQEGIFLMCDRVRIEQLIYILLDNAFRYTNEGKVTLTLRSEMNHKILIIEDTGCGIEAEALPAIFERFYRTDPTREKGGAGLGLSIAHAIVTAHGGKITANSTLGKGSVFTVTF